MVGIIKRTHGTGRPCWLIQPIPDDLFENGIVVYDIYMSLPTTEGVANISIDWEDAQHLTEEEIGKVVEYKLEDTGKEIFKKGHYKPWIQARLTWIHSKI